MKTTVSHKLRSGIKIIFAPLYDLFFEHPAAPESTHLLLLPLLLDRVGHEPLLGALGAEDVLVVGDEPLADHGGLAGGAEEAVVVPVPALERDEARPADAWRVERAGNFGLQEC